MHANDYVGLSLPGLGYNGYHRLLKVFSDNTFTMYAGNIPHNNRTCFGGIATFIGPAQGSNMYIYNSSGVRLKTSKRVLWIKSLLELFFTVEDAQANSIQSNLIVNQVIYSHSSNWNSDLSLICHFNRSRLLGINLLRPFLDFSVALYDHLEERVPFQSILTHSGIGTILFLPTNFIKLDLAIGARLLLGGISNPQLNTYAEIILLHLGNYTIDVRVADNVQGTYGNGYIEKKTTWGNSKPFRLQKHASLPRYKLAIDYIGIYRRSTLISIQKKPRVTNLVS
jgi:hypothetical protein